MEKISRPFPGVWGWICFLLYAGMLVALVLAIHTARRNAVTTFNTPEARQNWDDWRDEVKHREGASGPVERRIPKSAEPPTLVLLRDHFAVCLGASLVISSALYWTFVLMIRGAVLGPRFPIDTDRNVG